MTLWAKSSEQKDWLVFTDNLDRRSKKMDKLSSDLFFTNNIQHRSIKFLRNSPYGFINSSRECVTSGSENLLSWLASSDTMILQQNNLFPGSLCEEAGLRRSERGHITGC